MDSDPVQAATAFLRVSYFPFQLGRQSGPQAPVALEKYDSSGPESIMPSNSSRWEETHVVRRGTLSQPSTCGQ